MEASGGHDLWRRQEDCRQKKQPGSDLQDTEVQGQGNPYMQGDMEAQAPFADGMHRQQDSPEESRGQHEYCVLEETEVQQSDGEIGEIDDGQSEDVVLGDTGVLRKNAVLGGTVVQKYQDLDELQRLSGVHGQHVCEEDKLMKWAEVQKQTDVLEGSVDRGKVDGDKQQEKAAGEDSVYRTEHPQEITGGGLERDHLQKKCSVTGSQQYARLFTADTSTEAQELENSVEEMLIRLDEFCAMMDMIRSETSLIIEEEIPAIELRVKEMTKIYCRVDKLEAFVKMVAHHVSFLEEEVIRAERNNLSFPQAVNRLFTEAPIPLFRLKRFKKQSTYELPALYRTEDYFPAS